jgi:hypothetical protein
VILSGLVVALLSYDDDRHNKAQQDQDRCEQAVFQISDQKLDQEPTTSLAKWSATEYRLNTRAARCVSSTKAPNQKRETRNELQRSLSETAII